MPIIATSKTRRKPGPDIRTNCPVCGPNSESCSYELEEKMGLFFIPMITQRETYVECKHCKTARLVDVPMEFLAYNTADELDRHLRQRVSIVVKFCAIMSVLMFFAPLLAPIMGIVGLLATYRSGGWLKWMSMLGIALSIPFSGFILYAMIFLKPVQN